MEIHFAAPLAFLKAPQSAVPPTLGTTAQVSQMRLALCKVTFWLRVQTLTTIREKKATRVQQTVDQVLYRSCNGSY